MDTLNTTTPHVSIVIPVYNESGNLASLVDEIEHTLVPRMRFEVIVVDDGSNDPTPDEVAGLGATRPWLRAVAHEMNLGQSAAIRTGVLAARAPIVAVLDGDGQNDPADLPKLYAALEFSGASMIVGERRTRRDTYVRRLSSRIANGVRSSLLHDGIRDTGCGLKMFRREIFLELPAFDHMHRFLPALVQSRGGTVRTVPVNHRPRRFGQSKYGIRNRLWTGILDLVGVMWLSRRQIPGR
ncbi:MAG: glycosyltransferase family 2 protein [Woeseiaceae bacterium]|nr:glycosyltransferase family 2 protein [Woeseiaceae bacterium]